MCYRFKRSKTFVKGPGEQYQADLCDLKNISIYNKGYQYLLTCIDCFSCFAWVKPIKTKEGQHVSRVLGEIFSKKPCKRLQTDKGKEFLNKNVKQVLLKHDIQLCVSNNEDIKSTIVERFNRTIKEKMFKYFTANNTNKYIDILQNLVNGYNKTKHSSTGYAPKQVLSIEDKIKIRHKLYGDQIPFSGYKLKIGDYVRISKAKHAYKKGYIPSWTE